MPRMNKKARIFMFAVIAAALYVFVRHCVLEWRLALPNLGQNAILYGSMLLLMIATRSLPLYLKPGQALDLSVIATASVYLVCGARTAILLYFISTFAVFERAEDDSIKSVYNMDICKSLFNLSNIILSIWLPALLCHALGFDQAAVRLPDMLPNACLFAVGTFVVNSFLSMTLFSLMGMVKPGQALRDLISLMPNVLAALPLGPLIAVIYAIPGSGSWIVLLMMLPLLLARRAWKLYLQSKNQQLVLIQAIVSAMEAKDTYTEGHSRRVRDYALMIGREMHLPHHQLEKLGTGALLHDVGKIGIEDDILHKPGPLNDDEWEKMRSHPDVGVHIVDGLGFDPEIIDIIRYHHCRLDGKGYPEQPTPSLLTEIMCVADAYDAMTSDRPYRTHYPKEKAFNVLIDGRGTQFSERAVDAFLRSMGEEIPAA